MSIVRVAVPLAALIALWIPPLANAQTGARRLTTLDALRQYPGYYHLQNILIRGEFSERDRRVVLVSDAQEISVVLDQDVRTTSGAVEVRGQLIDIGRLEPDDPRAGQRGDIRGADRWPRPGEEVFLRVTAVGQAQPAVAPTTRAVALEPWKFTGRPVTISGSFRGRNLFGDLPDSPGKSRYDFVLRGADGAIWVTGLRPRGRGFDLDVDRRVDSGRWLEATGVLIHERGLVRLEATRLVLGEAPTLSTATDEEGAPPAPPAPVEVVFHSPTEGDTDVLATDPVRIQFSRGLAEPTIAGRVRARYADPGLDPAAPQASLEVKTTYDAANRAIEIQFPDGLQPGRVVLVELLEGITGFDQGPVPAWALTFTVSN